MKVEEKANEYAICKSSSGVFQKAHIDDFIAGAEWMKEQLSPTTTETLQEGDWTKCEKFSEWVSLFEIENEGGQNYGDSDFDYFKEHDGFIYLIDNILLWGKGENFLPYQEFKQRAENTFKTK